MSNRPNILFIVADDLGYSDLGAFGGEIRTPNLDKLALNGFRMTNFHTASACSPTRAMLFSGTDNHVTGLGQLDEWVQRNEAAYRDQPGYEGYLNEKIAALPEILSDEGYHTILSGKWHLGLKPGQTPHARGFQKSFSLLTGAGMHFKYFPHLADGTPAIRFMPPIYVEDDKFLDPETLPDDFYSSDMFTSRLLEFLDDAKTNVPDKPWFASLTFTAPHWPIQAPREVIDGYKGMYDGGPEVLRQSRLSRMRNMGLIAEGVEAHPVIAPLEAEWESKSEDERKCSARTMEVYAAMVEKLDENVGRVVQYLEKTAQIENTFIFFCSDNGADGMLLEALPLFSVHVQPIIDRFYDNSIDNIGNKTSFKWYGPRWGQAATAPSRMYKSHISEGGIKCPAIVHYPKGFQQPSPEYCSDAMVTVKDLMPTVLELAGIAHPGTSFRGRPVFPCTGASWVSHLQGKTDRVHSEDTPLGFELFAQRALILGDFKIVFVPKPIGPGHWQLYNLKKDPGEVNDLSLTADGENEEKLQKMVQLWADYVSEFGVVDSTSLGDWEEYGEKVGLMATQKDDSNL